MSVPPRWLSCPRKGRFIGGRFIPFKTPLSSRYDQDVPEKCKFDIPMLLNYVEGMQLRMGLVVDLTKTDRFYDKRNLTEVGIGHYKLRCEGFGEAPTLDQVEEFKRVCSHFFEQHPGNVVGIHCTHGYNRTGFLIISYLVEVEDWSFEAAVTAFCQSRPPGIYKPGYLQVLADRLNSGSLADVSVPSRPDWCNEEEEEEEEDAGSSGGRSGRHKRRGREMQNDHARFVDGVVGPTFIGPPLREEVQQQCQYILSFDSTGFAGSQPVSMDVQNIRLLHENPYRVSWKADGTRYIMYIKKEGEVYMLDRDNAVFLINDVKFFSRQRLGQYLTDTLVDGEIVFDKTPTEIRPRYLIYDIMQFEGKCDIAQCDHETRLMCITKEMIEPRDAATQRNILDKSIEPFGIRAKMFWDVKETRMVLDSFMKKLTHKNDGLIFSPANDRYLPGRCDALLKWKPSDLNSVDFRLSIVERNQPGQLLEKEGQLFVGGYNQPFAILDLKVNKEAKVHNGRIIECYWDSSSGWNFMKVREDKSFPNGVTTAKSVVQSIQQPVTKQWLLNIVEKHRWKPVATTGNKRPGKTLEGTDGALFMHPSKIPRTQ